MIETINAFKWLKEPND